jgi:hypothetical protein
MATTSDAVGELLHATGWHWPTIACAQSRSDRQIPQRKDDDPAEQNVLSQTL